MRRRLDLQGVSGLPKGTSSAQEEFRLPPTLDILSHCLVGALVNLETSLVIMYIIL